MPKFLFNASSHHTFQVGGNVYHGGDIIECSEFEAAAAGDQMIPLEDDQATKAQRKVQEVQEGLNVETPKDQS